MNPTDAVFLSIIIPAYNRASLIERAIASVTANNGDDFEVLVVDDSSTDATAARVREIATRDSRVQLIMHQANRGACASRNTGARAARGQWLVFLDSDDELTADGLTIIRDGARRAPASVAKLKFSCRTGSGVISPTPASAGQIVDYAGFLRWSEATIGGLSETLPCVRRLAFLEVPYNEAPGWSEGIHELEFARRYNVQLCAEVVRLYHGDAPERLMLALPDTSAVNARGQLAHTAAMVHAHITAIETHAPRRALMLRREHATLTFLTGDRRAGFRLSVDALRRSPGNLTSWAVLVVGTMSPALLRYLRRRRHAGSIA
ncbi:MAG: glycosyltransferase family 2 protein [Gemmatimonas sp.]